MLTGWRAPSWAGMRFVLGLYLLVHFVGLLPWAAEVFSTAGMSPTVHSPLFRLVPSLLWLDAGPGAATAWVGLGALAAALLALGIRDRWAAGIALWVLAGLLAANPLIANPSLPHVGWMLLAHTLIPSAPSLPQLWRDPQCGQAWRLPPEVVAAGWAVAMLAYGYSGYTKLTAISWLDGSAMAHVLQNPLARPTGLRTWLLAHPAGLQAASFGALGLELGAPLFALSRRLRPTLWVALLGLQLGLLLLVDFADLTWGMLVLQLWLFDPAWVRPQPPVAQCPHGDPVCSRSLQETPSPRAATS